MEILAPEQQNASVRIATRRRLLIPCGGLVALALLLLTCASFPGHLLVMVALVPTVMLAAGAVIDLFPSWDRSTWTAARRGRLALATAVTCVLLFLSAVPLAFSTLPASLRVQTTERQMNDAAQILLDACARSGDNSIDADGAMVGTFRVTGHAGCTDGALQLRVWPGVNFVFSPSNDNAFWRSRSSLTDVHHIAGSWYEVEPSAWMGTG